MELPNDFAYSLSEITTEMLSKFLIIITIKLLMP